jgi:hypothetical protein
MTAFGVFAVDRGIFDHPMFAAEPFTEREAWMWLFGMAAWKDCKTRVGSAHIELKRGQMAFALRFLAVKWKWSEPRVRRFLKRLESDAMVLVQATRQATQITICNYDKYAFGRRTDVPDIDAQNVTETTHARRKEEEDNNLRSNNPIGRDAPSVVSPAVVAESEVYVLGREILGKGCGGVITKIRAHCRHDLRKVSDLLEQSRDKAFPMEWLQGVLRGTEDAKLPAHEIFPEEVYRNVL